MNSKVQKIEGCFKKKIYFGEFSIFNYYVNLKQCLVSTKGLEREDSPRQFPKGAHEGIGRGQVKNQPRLQFISRKRRYQ